ncbi:MATE family efflux transporter [Melittangium boletus]|uniref:MATE family efflux transporter n=1 Tax=Melittangium boletus DSM 14713 TaxID=1294270 RepID=A0A250IK65_9BACT|nr:MATE family efflux transporter [Melittangium boletus]ATB31610.1 MATE family efflux transporter [Melittangium boletus DSM 14713]
MHSADTTSSTPPGLLRLTWPIFLEFLLFMLMGTADTFMLSGVSDEAAAAVGVAAHYVLLSVTLMEVISNGAAIVVAQYIGAQRQKEAARIAALAISLNFLFGLVVSASLFLGGNTLMAKMNLSGDMLVHARTYVGIVGGFIFLQALINIFASLLRTYGFTKESMFVSLGMNLLHVVANYVLIFGHFGMPRMGVAGAAWSTVLSRTVALGVFVWMLYRVMDVRMKARDYVTVSRDYIRKIFHMGVPAAVEQITYHCCQTVFMYYVTFLGPVALASREYAMNVSRYIFLFSLSIGIGTSILVGRLVGAGRPDTAYQQALRSLKWGLSITVLTSLAAILLRQSLIGAFTVDPAVIQLASTVLFLSLLLETGRSCNLVLVNALRATGDAVFTVYAGFGSMVCMSLPLGYVLVFHAGLGLPGVWLAIAADEWTRALIMWLRWRSRAWEKKSLVTPAVESPEVAAVGA